MRRAVARIGKVHQNGSQIIARERCRNRRSAVYQGGVTLVECVSSSCVQETIDVHVNVFECGALPRVGVFGVVRKR